MALYIRTTRASATRQTRLRVKASAASPVGESSRLPSNCACPQAHSIASRCAGMVSCILHPSHPGPLRVEMGRADGRGSCTGWAPGPLAGRSRGAVPSCSIQGSGSLPFSPLLPFWGPIDPRASDIEEGQLPSPNLGTGRCSVVSTPYIGSPSEYEGTR
jgi:hypothetical protein